MAAGESGQLILAVGGQDISRFPLRRRHTGLPDGRRPDPLRRLPVGLRGGKDASTTWSCPGSASGALSRRQVLFESNSKPYDPNHGRGPLNGPVRRRRRRRHRCAWARSPPRYGATSTACELPHTHDGLTASRQAHGSRVAGRRVHVRTTIDWAEIAPPHDFGFQLRHYVTAPEVRTDRRSSTSCAAPSGILVKVQVRSSGTVERPRLT